MQLPEVRILDTRTGLGAPPVEVGEQRQITLAVGGRGGVPTSGVAAVVLNVIGVEPTHRTWLTVWPTRTPRPEASQLDPGPGDNRAALVTVPLGADVRSTCTTGAAAPTSSPTSSAAPGVDATVSAVSVNLVAQSQTSGWLTAWDGEGPVPGTSTVNYLPVTIDRDGRPWIEVFASSAVELDGRDHPRRR